MGISTLSAEDVQALKDITAVHISAILAQDWTAWTATCTDDVILLPPGDARVDGRETAAQWLEGFPKALEFAGEPSIVRGSGNMAFTSGSARGQMEIDGEAVDAGFKWLAVFEKQEDGTWKMLADMWNDDASSAA